MDASMGDPAHAPGRAAWCAGCKVEGVPSMSAPGPNTASSLSSSGFADGLGRRVLAFDRETGEMLERLVLRPELGAFEKVLLARNDALTKVDDERFAHPRDLEEDEEGRLCVVSEFVPGRRLSEALDAAPDAGIVPGLDAALGLLLEILPARGSLHGIARFAHGSLCPGHVVFPPAGQIVLLDPIYGSALERLGFTRQRLWNEFGIAVPASAGPARFDTAADLTQAAMTAAALIVGRPLGAADYPAGMQSLRAEILEVAQIRGTTGFANGIEKFFDRVLPLTGRKAFPSADDAVLDLRQLVRKEIGIEACRTALLDFLQQVESADAERAAADEALAAERASGEHEQARVDAEHREREKRDAERRPRERAEADAQERARVDGERRAKDKQEAERRERERLEAERREQERLDAERREQERLEAERKEKDRIEAERRKQERQEAERRERERIEAERREKERLEAERREQARLEAERRENERLEAERRERERLEAEQLERERIEHERLEAEQRERERLEAERLEKERVERERIARERLEAELRERARLEAEQREKERLERERIARERLEAEQRERARLEAERREKERLEAERREKERLEAERRKRERVEAERRERERLEAERREKERLETERLERERQAKLEAERKEKERLEAERRERERQAKLEAERKEKERLEAERRERERQAKLEAERKEKEKERLEAERREKERVEAERRERERLAKLEAERKEKERLEAERQQKERIARERAEAERREKERAAAERREQERREQERREHEQREQERREHEQREEDRREEELAAQAGVDEHESAGSNKRRKKDKSARSKKDRLRSAAPAGATTATPTPAQAPAAAGSKSSWLVPPDRAAAFDPPVLVTAPPPVQVAAPQGYPVYVAPAAHAPVVVAAPAPVVVPPVVAPPVAAPTPIGFAPARPAAQPHSAPIGLAQPAPIRLKQENTPPPASYTPRRDRDVAFTPDFSANPTDKPAGGIPWKIAAAAGVALLIGMAAVHSLWPAGGGRPGPTKTTVSSGPEPKSVPAPSSTAGQIVVSTQPAGARVLLDGKTVGESPVTLPTVTPGRHTVTLITESGTVKKSVRVEAGKTLSLDIPIFSGFAAISAPIVVEVSEGSRLLGTSENQVMLSPGRHTLKFTNNALNYSGTQTVEIEPGEVYKLGLDPRGSANINAQPWAEVWIDGVRVGETPIANVSIALGVREIVFRNPQFGERKVVTTITGGAPAALSVDFNKQ